MSDISVSASTQQIVVNLTTTEIEVGNPHGAVSIINAGPQGPPGPRGPSGGEPFVDTQLTPVLNKTINHNLGRKPLIELISLGGVALQCEIQHLNDNQIQVAFNVAQAFVATMI